jgi:hypothetical protein
MFCEFSACIMEAAHRLGIHGLNLPTVPEDDGSIILFFSQLAEQLDDASAKVLELIDAECRELLGLAGTWIFSNLQRLRPDLDLEEVLQRRAPPLPGTRDRATQARAVWLDIALQRLQAIYAHPGTSIAAGQDSQGTLSATPGALLSLASNATWSGLTSSSRTSARVMTEPPTPSNFSSSMSSPFRLRMETSVRWLIGFLWPSKMLRGLGS